jgi:hypothetical protein
MIDCNTFNDWTLVINRKFFFTTKKIDRNDERNYIGISYYHDKYYIYINNKFLKFSYKVICKPELDESFESCQDAKDRVQVFLDKFFKLKVFL